MRGGILRQKTLHREAHFTDSDIQLLMVAENSLSTTMEHEGYKLVGIHAHVAPTFSEMKKILNKQAVDIILIDWEYTQLNPFEVIQFIRNSENFKNIPIIVSSVHVYDDKLSRHKEIDLFIKQPVPRVLVLERIKRLINKKIREEERVSWNEFYLGNVTVRAKSENYEMVLADVSLSGIFLYSEDILDVGVEVDLEFNLPGVKELLTMRGEVVRVTRMHKINDRMNKGIGIKFTKFNGDTQLILEYFLKNNKTESDFMQYYL